MHDLSIHCMLNWALTMLEESVSAMAIGASADVLIYASKRASAAGEVGLGLMCLEGWK